jgi:hypothetical protein
MTYPSLLKVTAAETNILAENKATQALMNSKSSRVGFRGISREIICPITAKKSLLFRPASGITALGPIL